MDWARLATGLAITVAVPGFFIGLPLLLGTLIGRAIARGNRGK
jgi:hypothetical protein